MKPGAFIALLLIAAPVSAQTPDPVLQKDMALFLDWFPGRYDNDLQVFWEPDLKVPEEARHERIHSIFRPVDLPAFGEHAFYVEQYSNGDPKKLYRQRIYVFVQDDAEKAIRLKIFTPKAPEKLAGAWRDPKLLAKLKPADAANTPGCDVFWRRQANQFLGSMKPGACRITSQRSGKEIVITDDLVLTPEEIWIADRATTTDGAYVFGNKAGVPHKLKKARPFDCWASILRGAKHGDRGAGLDSWQFWPSEFTHDQGGEIHLKTDETPPREVRLLLRRVEWPTGTRRPSLTLYAHEGADKRAVSYAWTEGDGERIGINLRWLQASCTHAPERLFDDRSKAQVRQ
jgi:hypothetical protein